MYMCLNECIYLYMHISVRTKLCTQSFYLKNFNCAFLFIGIIYIFASVYIQMYLYKHKSPLSWLAETIGTLCVLNLVYNVYTVNTPLTLAPAFSFSATYSSLFQLPSTDKSRDRHTDDFFKLPLNSFSQKRTKLIRKI